MDNEFIERLKEFDRYIDDAKEKKNGFLKNAELYCGHCGTRLKVISDAELSVSGWTRDFLDEERIFVNSPDNEYCYKCLNISVPKSEEEMNTVELRGFITYDNVEGLFIGTDNIVKEVRDNLCWRKNIKGDKVGSDMVPLANVSLFVYKSEVTDEQILERILTGDIAAKHEDAGGYSEYTRWDMTEGLVVGGHDLHAIIKSFVGMYAVLKITG